MNKYETKMDKITTEFAEHICDNLCRYPHMADGKSLEIICSECKIGKFICDILNEYNRINDFDKTQTAKLLKQVQELKEPIIIGVNGAIGCRVGKCPKCGGILRSYMRFCDECGQRLDWRE